MNEIERKYIDNKLHREELPELQDYLHHTDDDTITLGMKEIWSETPLDSNVNREALKYIKDKVNVRILSERDSHPNSNKWKWMAIASIILLPIMIGMTVFFLYPSSVKTGHIITVSTGLGERATVTLPDGTLVTLNYNSKLTYDDDQFLDKLRKIDFTGEAYFKVTKDEEHPFIISNKNIEISVLGTKFDMKARDMDKKAQVALDEGLVLVKSRNNQCRKLKPGYQAEIDYHSGNITVNKQSASEDIKAWRENALHFKNTSLTYVFKTLEDVYGKTIITRFSKVPENFVGTLPMNDLQAALYTLQIAYGLNYKQEDDKIIVYQ